MSGERLNKLANTTAYSIYPTRGWQLELFPVNNDTSNLEVFCQLQVTNAGALVVKGVDGEIKFYPQLNPGVIYPIVGVAVVQNATIVRFNADNTESNEIVTSTISGPVNVFGGF